MIVDGGGDRLAVGRPCRRTLHVEGIGYGTRVGAIGLHGVQERLSALPDRECDVGSIGGDCGTANDSGFLTTRLAIHLADLPDHCLDHFPAAPQLRGGFIDELPDAVAGVGGGDVEKKFGASRGEKPVPVVRAIGAGVDAAVGESAIGRRQRVLFAGLRG